MFVALAGVLYIILAVLGIFAFDWSLNYSIDQQLRVLASDFGHAIELDGDTPHFRDWLRVVQTEPARSLAAIQLFNPDGALIEHYGPPGPATLSKSAKQTSDFRLIVSPLTRNSRTLGFLQIAIPTTYRDQALHTLEITAAFLAPCLLLGLGLTGYVVSDVATAPIRDNLKMLKQFLADASHELNTPISIVKARAEMLEKKLQRLNWDNQDLQTIDVAIERMEKIVDDLMLLAEIDGTLTQNADETVQVDQTLRSIITEFQPKFDGKQIRLHLAECASLTAHASEESLHMIVANLVENAFRYTEPGGSVTVALGGDNSFAKIEIKDTGIGIPPDHLPFVFDRFYRVDKSRSRASGGSGLGLAIVKALVESHNGHVNVLSRVGEGTVFTVLLRIKA
jgi:signal transduction histidine kinase